MTHHVIPAVDSILSGCQDGSQKGTFTMRKKKSPPLALDNLREAALVAVKAVRATGIEVPEIEHLHHVATRRQGKPGIPDETVELIRRLRAEGKTITETAKLAQVSTQTVVRHSLKKVKKSKKSRDPSV